MYQPTSEPAYQRLLNNLQEAVKFGRRFQEPTFYRSVVRVAFRKTYAEELAKLNLAITESATDLDLVQGMDFEQRRREDIEDANASFQYCVDRMLEEISLLGEQSAEQFAQLQADIQGNKQYLKTLLDLMEHRKLKPVEQAKVDEAMDAIAGRVEKCHREVMAALQKISGKMDVHHDQLSGKMEQLGGNMTEVSEKLAQVHSLLSLLSEKQQSPAKEQQRTFHLNRHVISLSSVTWNEQEVLGSGAFGTVYKGSYQGNQVAVKIIPMLRGATKREVEKHVRALENEVILLREVEYPAILHCYGFGRDQTTGNFIIVTEVAPLGSLDTLLEDDTWSFPALLRLAWCGDVINAVEFVHSKGITHRDIKAENFLVFFPLHLKLCDFGLAREQSSSLRGSTIGGAGGTMGFMAPELLLTGATCASDMYSYAMTTVQIITGDHPKQGMAEQQVRSAVAELDLPHRGAKEALLAVLIKCCFYDPSSRSDPVSLRPSANAVKVEIALIVSNAGGDMRNSLEIHQLASKIVEHKLQDDTAQHTALLSPSEQTFVPTTPASEKLAQRELEQARVAATAQALDFARKELEAQTKKLQEEKERLAAQQKAMEEAARLEKMEREVQAKKEQEERARHAAQLKAQEEAARIERVAQAKKVQEEAARQAARQKALDDAHRERELQAEREKAKQAAEAAAAPQRQAELERQQRASAVSQLLSQLDLQAIALSGNARILEELDKLDALGSIPDVNKVYPYDARKSMTALMIASSLGHTMVVALLLKVPTIDVNFRENTFGYNALMRACGEGRTETVQVLLADGRVEINRQDLEKWTALIHACANGSEPCVQALLGVSNIAINLKNDDGFTALDTARGRRHKHIVTILKAKGATGTWKGYAAAKVEKMIL